MAEQLLDGPPNKRQKLGAPGAFTDNAGGEKLQNQGQDQLVETRHHCNKCEDYDLCVHCYNEKGHDHKMDKVGLDLDLDQQQEQGGEKERPQLSAQEERRLKIERCIQDLTHANFCRDINCQLAGCSRMKRVIEHTKTCKRKIGGGCRICQQLIHLCCYHAKRCSLERECEVPFCRYIKLKIRQQKTQQSMQPPSQMPGQPMPPSMAGRGNC